MIELSMVAVPPSDEHLQTMAQIGISNLVHYDMSNETSKFDQFPEMVAKAKHFGLKVPVIESGPAIDKIIFNKPGAEEQIQHWISSIEFLSQHGVEVICYNFMPQVLDDAMVVRTSFDTETRGGALTSAFRSQDLNDQTVPHTETAISDEEMWANLKTFLDAVIPTAEKVGVKLAMHPDDPPLSPIAGLSRIMSSVDDFDRLLLLNPSISNGITLCAGCFGELGEDVPALVDRFKDRIHFVHFRNIKGEIHDFMETFPDDGDIDLLGLFEVLEKQDFKAYVRADHAPLLATEKEAGEDGYGFQGHLHTSGYMQGVLDTARRQLKASTS
ncbi:MAG: mannonate dehydratase [Pseudomonadota bacterium]